MEAEIKKPSPPGRWEKALTRSYWWVLLGGMLISSILRVPLGFWPSLALTVAVIVAFTLVVARLAASEREARLVRDVERGLIECAIRYSKALPGSLSSRWEQGFAEVNNGIIKFRPLFGEMESPAGHVREFSDLSSYRLLDLPPKRPAELKRSWKIAAIGTDKGDLEVATGEAGLSLLAGHIDPNTGPS
ncbi:hypothetical protein [Arthrobacter globiformis]|uniref:Uncharacterized protein n=1 Tax=Arthrobacter globiformis TaxID=1665 RepID=A0A328HK87_ARTGO|nr:hypothetical protein [Arthrobacter globiformis]RAM38571.1 hypothetical protein DBZ45_04205 [Arthrobacter globiformis]